MKLNVTFSEVPDKGSFGMSTALKQLPMGFRYFSLFLPPTHTIICTQVEFRIIDISYGTQ